MVGSRNRPRPHAIRYRVGPLGRGTVLRRVVRVDRCCGGGSADRIDGLSVHGTDGATEAASRPLVCEPLVIYRLALPQTRPISWHCGVHFLCRHRLGAQLILLLLDPLCRRLNQRRSSKNHRHKQTNNDDGDDPGCSAERLGGDLTDSVLVLLPTV